MKQFFLLAFLLTAATSVFAQRSVDLQLTVHMPAEGEYIPPMQAFTLQVSVKNVGTEDLLSTDSLYYYMAIDGNTVIFQPDNEDHVEITGNYLAPGDSLIINRVMLFTDTYEGEAIELCVSVFPVNAADEIGDPLPNDNTGCRTVNVMNDPAGIEEQQAVFTVFPNPVTDVLHVASEAAIEELVLADASGKTVAIKEGDLEIDCSALTPGIYVLTAVTAHGVSSQRIVVE